MIESTQNRARRPCGVSLGLILATLVVFVVPGWNEAHQLDRGGIAAGKWWLLLSGHFTHWNLDHFTWDLLTFAVLAAFCESRSRRRFLVCLGLSGFVISVGFLCYEIELTAYRGLSGLDSALFGLAMAELVRAARTERRKALQGIAIAGTVGFLGKTLVELTTGGTVFVANTDGAFLPVPSAHLLGFLCGFAAGWTWQPGRTRARATVSGPRRISGPRLVKLQPAAIITDLDACFPFVPAAQDRHFASHFHHRPRGVATEGFRRSHHPT